MEGRDWTSTKILEVRLSELVLQQGRLLRSGLAANTIEVTTARRTFQKLMGPTGGNFFKWEVDRCRRKCWSYLVSNKEQATQTLQSLKEGLKLAKEKCSKYQSKAKLVLSERQYQVRKEKIILLICVTWC